MATRNLTALDRLLRYRQFVEARAQVSLLTATQAWTQASTQERTALQRLHDLALWKARQDAAGGLQLAHYQQALVMEQQAVGRLEHASQALQQATEEREAAHVALNVARNEVKVVEQRRQRAARALTEAEAQRQSDAAADLWLMRNRHARA